MHSYSKTYASYNNIEDESMKIKNAVVERLRELADEKGITLYKLQKDSGIPEGTFLTLIYGDRKGVNLTTLLTVIRGLEISLKEFFDSPLFDDLDD